MKSIHCDRWSQKQPLDETLPLWKWSKNLRKASHPNRNWVRKIRCFYKNPGFSKDPKFYLLLGFSPLSFDAKLRKLQCIWIRAPGFAFQFARQAPCGNTCRFWAFCFFIASGAFCYWTIGTDSQKKVAGLPWTAFDSFVGSSEWRHDRPHFWHSNWSACILKPNKKPVDDTVTSW